MKQSSAFLSRFCALCLVFLVHRGIQAKGLTTSLWERPDLPQDTRILSRGGWRTVYSQYPLGFLSNPAQLAFVKTIVHSFEVLSPMVLWSEETFKVLDFFMQGQSSNVSSILGLLNSLENDVIHSSFSHYMGLALKNVSFGTHLKGLLNLGSLWEPMSGLTSLSVAGWGEIGGHLSTGFFVIPNSLALGFNLRSYQFWSFDQSLNFSSIAQTLVNKGKLSDLVNGSGLRQGRWDTLDVSFLWERVESFMKSQIGLTMRNALGKFSGVKGPRPNWERRIVDLGVGVQFASELSSLSLGLEWRDLFFAYNDKLFKKLFLGTEWSISQLFGFGLGVSQGYWSYGMFVSLRWLRLDIGMFTTELGSLPGELPNRRLMAQMKIGWNL